jgi:hypothetical protein
MTTSEPIEIMQRRGPSDRHQVDVATCAAVSLGEAAHVLGIHRSTAWDLHKRGRFPVPVLQVGHGLRVAKIHLERFLLAGEYGSSSLEGP